MQVRIKQVRSLRLKRNWTQQYLADASGLSLRTVQRIEKYGNASAESVMSLCAALQVDADEIKTVPNQDSLIVSSSPIHNSLLFTLVIIAFAIVFGVIVGGLVMYFYLS